MSLMDALPTPRLRWEGRHPNIVLLSLSLIMLITFWAFDVVSMAPNRIVLGTGYGALEAFGWPGALLATLLLSSIAILAWQPSIRHYRALLAAVLLLMALMPVGLIASSYLLIDPELPQARLGLGAAYWVVLFVLLLCLIEIRLRLHLSRLWPTLLLCGVALVWWLCAAFWLDSLALVQEFRARDQQFLRAIGQHMALVGIAVSSSVLVGLVLAMLMRRYARLQKAAFSVLNFLQTIPSLALFGLLLAPLAWLAENVPFLDQLGVSGIGTTPALIALIAYSLLPMVRNTYIALEEVSPNTLEAAKGMGMRAGQRFWQVRLPLALPVLLEGCELPLFRPLGSQRLPL
ncbi:osmoprotectant uptake system permease [Vreelandella sulfidaeris]|uniref:Osmoprotectant uptake system permease n=1 Tax=Vreelandella sulfidaeris TaxID=115553 RepID=A0A455UC86_9GAMM|nr:osmoprotectant uptake system permease [Halomonas sulfidaeris]